MPGGRHAEASRLATGKSIQDLPKGGGICMAMKNITIRMDEDLKRELEKTLDELGLNMTAFFTMAAKQCVHEQRLPFSVSRKPAAKNKDEAPFPGL